MTNETNNIVRYGAYTPDAADSDAATVESLANATWLSLTEGENVIRVLPPPVGKNSPFRVTALHYIDALPGLDKLIVFACPRVELKKPCPACAEAERLLRTGNPLDRERSNRISSSLRIYVNVIDRRFPEHGPRVLTLGKSLHQQLVAIRKSARGGDFTDPSEKGFDIIITKTGTGLQTRYTLAADRTCSPLAPTDELIADILDQQHDLDALVDTSIPEIISRMWSTSSQPPQQVRVQPLGPGAAALPPPSGQRVGAGLMRPASQAVSTKPAAPATTAVQDGGGEDDGF